MNSLVLKRSLLNKKAIASVTVVRNNHSLRHRFWEWTTQDRPKWTTDAKEFIIVCAIFAMTGSTSMLAVRPALKHSFGIEGTLADGPNEYRIMSILCVPPVYSVLLLLYGTLGGRHRFFAAMATKIFGRYAPKKLVNKILCKPAKFKNDVSK